MNTHLRHLLTVFLSFAVPAMASADDLRINDQGYFAKPGLNVTVFADIYPDGHQTGVSIIQHGQRVAANGDLRLETSPGQWSPVPKGLNHQVDEKHQTITQTLAYPDESKDRKGFNPIAYPQLNFTYKVKVTALRDNSFKVSVDLDQPLPAEWIGKAGFNFELFPGHLFGKSWMLDDSAGQFPQQPNGPMIDDHGEWLNAPLATGNTLVVAPGEPLQRITITSAKGELQLLDGRSNHNNGWYIVRSLIPAGATTNAVEWTITPNTVANWRYSPVIQVSQLGYGSRQSKRVIIEQDARDHKASTLTLYRLTAEGAVKVRSGKVSRWGKFLRYNYFTYDFSSIQEPGLYQIRYRDERSHTFKIGDDVFARHAWQPTLEYYLPVQMCHMKVAEKYRVWHGLCHQDDAKMSPVNHNHFDGYIAGESTLTQFEPGQVVGGLNRGGWHDAGDYDLRVESQIGTVWLLAMMVEQFNLNYDATTVDQQQKLVEIHQPDGKNDALQQIEHGLLTVLGGYQQLGRLYRGIIVPTIRQYVHLGDAATQTDNKTGTSDDRWVFTEQNPDRELYVAAGLAAAARVMNDYDNVLAKRALAAAKAIYRAAAGQGGPENTAFALTELLLSTGDTEYRDALIAQQNSLLTTIDKTGWTLGRVRERMNNPDFVAALDSAASKYQAGVQREAGDTPYGVPYKPYIWGAGWGVQSFAVKQYFYRQAWPQFTRDDDYLNALNFVLGVHPGENTQSFASGVGANSATVAYGVNRADWSFIPGGVISGTALIRPDLPELKTWPFFWQQTEYVMGGGATNYMFLVLAANHYLQQQVAAP